MIVTRHALRRFVQRIRPDADEREARVVLGQAVRTCVLTPKRTDKGQTVWRVDYPAMYLVVKHDRQWGQIVVTILGPEEWSEEA